MSSDTLPARPRLSHDGVIQGLGVPETSYSFSKLKSGMRANSSASSSCSLSLNLLKYETDPAPDWNPEFLCDSRSTLLFVILLPAALRAFQFVSLPKRFLYTLPALTNAGAKTTTNYTKKATVVTADSTMVDSSTLNPVFWGLILCARVCFWVRCGLARLDFVFGCLEQMLGGQISNSPQSLLKKCLCSSRLNL